MKSLMSKIDAAVLFVTVGVWEFISFFWPVELELGTVYAIFYM